MTNITPWRLLDHQATTSITNCRLHSCHAQTIGWVTAKLSQMKQSQEMNPPLTHTHWTLAFSLQHTLHIFCCGEVSTSTNLRKEHTDSFCCSTRAWSTFYINRKWWVSRMVPPNEWSPVNTLLLVIPNIERTWNHHGTGKVCHKGFAC